MIRRHNNRFACPIVLCIAAAILCTAAQTIAKEAYVNLPYRTPQADAAGNWWFIYQNGWLREQGGMPTYQEAAVLTVANQQPTVNNNQAKQEDNGDIVLEDMQAANGCTVTRRIKMVRDESYVRIIDIFKNKHAHEVTVDVNYRSSLTFGLQNSQAVEEPRKKIALAVVAQDGQGRNIMEVYAAKGARLIPATICQPGGNGVVSNIKLVIPANKEIALAHIHGVIGGFDAGTKFVLGMKEAKLFADEPKSVRRLIANFPSVDELFADTDILRGDVFDVIELRGGDQIRGMITDPVFRLQTAYGPVELSAKQVIGIVNVGASQPRQLLVTGEGEVYGGRLDARAVALEMSSGQKTQIPVAQIARLGFRRRVQEAEEWTFDKPMVFLRTGERMRIRPYVADIPVVTRYGNLNLPAASVASIGMQNEETTAHVVTLTDGSRFTALVAADGFDVTLDPAGGSAATTAPSAHDPGPVRPTSTIRLPVAILQRLLLNSKVQDVDENAATLRLVNDDVLVAAIGGQIKLQTPFDTLSIDAAQIKRMGRSKPGAGTELQITLWDDTTLSGVPVDSTFAANLRGGINMSVPIALLTEYLQPLPQPGAAMVERVKQIVAELNNDDFKVREHAQGELVTLGSGISSILKQLRADQPPEAQQRIDAVLNGKAKPAPPAADAPEPDDQ